VQSFAEDVLAAGMLVADVLVMADNCTPYKYCNICSLTSSYEKIKICKHRSRKYRKIIHVEASTQITHPFAAAENLSFFFL
jgi:recombinational DNA repair protein RecR